MKVVFLGRIGERAGPPRELSEEGLVTVADAVERLTVEDDELASLLRAPSTVYVLDDRVVKGDAALEGASELAFLPPVSGG
ncbi:MoaD/ThiS family protein [Parvularcula maris]|uniref:MoaD/ThiS family protein n=1 Tax=Parvularcula maris TaxID=2965077 RepID=A0A9X2RIE3_9PROT|nr:MoaD/ThiS family protein [Parvularcula maris]MCQ8184861.1 MoaD/ThiS family protein [Parvularcula maris]